MLARDLGNEPPHVLTPLAFLARVQKQFVNSSVSVQGYVGQELEERGMVGVLAVGRGSQHPSVFLELRYCTDSSKPLIALVGKGITFDTGGISLKRDFNIRI